MDQTEETDGLQVTYKVQSTIHGDWEVLLGDLYMTYDVFFGMKISDIKLPYQKQLILYLSGMFSEVIEI